MSHGLRCLVLAVVLIVASGPSAWAQFGHPADAVAAGGETVSNTSFSVRGTLGEPLVDRVRDGTQAVNQGFWHVLQGVGSTALLVEDVSVSGNGLVDFGPTGVDLQFSGTSGSGLVTVEKFNDGPVSPSGISEQNVSQYRFVVSMGGNLSVGAGTEVRLGVGSLGGIGSASNVVIYTRPSEDAGSFGGRSTTFDSGTNELVAPTDTLRELVLASDTEPLPVELAHFGAHVDGETVVLRWTTATETNNSGFQVQRKRPAGDRWKKIGFVGGAGTTTTSRSYRFLDEDIPYAADSLTYRLQQVDTDGRTSSSAPVTVQRTAPSEVQLLAPFPNPARTRATVRFSIPQRQKISLRLYDVLGRRLATLKRGMLESGRKQFRLKTSDLPSGMYFLHLRAGGRTITQELVVAR